jgi:hypothetical protein
VQISRLPAGLSNEPPPTKQIASVNLHYPTIIPHSAVFVNAYFAKIRKISGSVLFLECRWFVRGEAAYVVFGTSNTLFENGGDGGPAGLAAVRRPEQFFHLRRVA